MNKFQLELHFPNNKKSYSHLPKNKIKLNEKNLIKFPKNKIKLIEKMTTLKNCWKWWKCKIKILLSNLNIHKSVKPEYVDRMGWQLTQ